MDKLYGSKRDLWILVLVWAGMLLVAFAAVTYFRSNEPLIQRVIVLGLSILVSGFVLSMLYNIRYAIGDDELRIHSWPFRYSIPLADIDRIRPSRNPLSSPAASLDRLMVTWRGGRKRILISPVDKVRFMADIKSRCPHLAQVGDELVRVSS